MSEPTLLPEPIQRDDVRSHLPSLGEQIDLVEQTYRAMARGAVEMPPKIGVHPRQHAFLHAMPAYLVDDDVVALKWVSGFPANPARGLPYISGVIIVNDAESGIPRAIMDAAEITAARTAAVSGLCVKRWAPEKWARAAILGCGEQGRYHATMLRFLNPDAEIVAFDPEPGKAAALGDVRAAAAPETAVEGAEVVITAGPIVLGANPPMRSSWLEESWLLLPIDFDLYVSAELTTACDLLISDDLHQFEYYREAGHFRDWRSPSASVGQALEAATTGERVIACNLGVAALDAAFARFVLDQLEPSASEG
jgi:ornithine cyclodeaminase/alanine dehydrogenase-like protein (mu-crystallin family)